MEPESKLLSNIFTLNRIKSILQKNKKIGKISSTVLFFMGRFLELFLVDIINNLIFLAKKNGRNRIKKKDLGYFIKKKENIK
ncbi:hypothetical protein T484DRAFT_1650499 [Baffinella frigidus]|jgi:histone H3/H4|nr:hypothetical protein T484DRAFT_1650499 [Cryptophyta sp. CCMP2293]|mmetsp:Transcript_14785/g.33107  ORF Transcript_14785/g.33107 Transcript_14785/m.33107 type:complete len:82 (-) Transcript_14785:219-464(-)